MNSTIQSIQEEIKAVENQRAGANIAVSDLEKELIKIKDDELNTAVKYHELEKWSIEQHEKVDQKLEQRRAEVHQELERRLRLIDVEAEQQKTRVDEELERKKKEVDRQVNAFRNAWENANSQKARYQVQFAQLADQLQLLTAKLAQEIEKQKHKDQMEEVKQNRKREAEIKRRNQALAGRLDEIIADLAINAVVVISEDQNVKQICDQIASKYPDVAEHVLYLATVYEKCSRSKEDVTDIQPVMERLINSIEAVSLAVDPTAEVPVL